MATVLDSTPTSPQQPGLRAFIVYDQLPAGCAAYPVPDGSNEPHLSTGEWVIVDPADREPAHDEMFVLQWQSGGPPMVMVTRWMDKLGCWAATGARPALVADIEGLQWVEGGGFSDFGYRTEQMMERIKGRVVGILEARTIDPARDVPGSA